MTAAADLPSVRIGDGWLIAVPDGSYTLSVTQSIAPQGDIEHDFSENYTIDITGPRFAINPSDLHSRFPAPGSTGAYASLLPHAVLARATLPWERALTGSVTVTAGHIDQTLPTPFVAVIVFSGETPPGVTSGTVHDVINPPSGIFRPTLTLQSGESLADPCLYIDLDVGQYNEALPQASDLPYLAHIRQVDTSAKATGESTDDGWYAVVLANRLPAPAAPPATAPSTAYLVSLEGYAPYLPLTGATFPGGLQTTRLVVLTSWTFADNGAGAQEFTQTLTGLGSAGLAVSALQGGDGAGAALGIGYVPMNHITRQAQTVVSWYRGPLIPLSMSAAPARSYSCSDAALRFDPATGMLDLTYAAAWQLGRLMALGDREVAEAIDNWRRSDRRRAGQLVTRITLARRFPALGLGRTAEALLAPHAVRRTFATLLAGELVPGLIDGQPSIAPAADAPGSLAPADEQHGLMTRLRADADHWLGITGAQDPPVPDLIVQWLARLAALDGVPFNHLVPDPRALPVESIRFFFVDPDWILALLDGAMSIGRTTTFDREHDSALGPLVGGLAIGARLRLRDRSSGRSSIPALDTVSGFLVRSRAVAHWRGVEVTVYPDAGAQQPPLPLIRLVRLSDSVLLCLVAGALARVDFRQPIEGLQLGARGATDLTVTLRGLGYGNFPVGTSLQTSSLSWRGDPTGRLLDIAGSATSVAAALWAKGAWPQNQPLSSGDFAMQVLESAQVVTMTMPASWTAARQAPAPDPRALLSGGRTRLEAFIARELADVR